ncbi:MULTISPECIES: MliC family protein [Halomonadaceae]|uniref:MliC family protein n=1 Tax=Halomonadaceae TaxID=28256 RepID=UPI0015982B8D|nr:MULTISPECIES: MliC family protein [Halomonas]QJQ94535.1 C-type lysozyme, inhibitor [Halomonas sp. PA5]
MPPSLVQPRLCRPAPWIVMGSILLLTGCASAPPVQEQGKPAVVDSSAALAISPQGNEVEIEALVHEPAPLMPSVFFAGGAGEFASWRCQPAQDLVSAQADAELRLWSQLGAYRLAPAVVASGARYVVDDLSFWNRGEEALVESNNGRLACQRDMTRRSMTRIDRPGVMFHGRGNEPGWVVSLDHDAPRLTLLLDYGERELTLPYRVEALDNQEGRMVLTSGQATQPFTLSLEARACFDDMKGDPFPVRVTLGIDGRTLRGCGQGIAP